jgi:hypothetical protein
MASERTAKVQELTLADKANDAANRYAFTEVHRMYPGPGVSADRIMRKREFEAAVFSAYRAGFGAGLVEGAVDMRRVKRRGS